MAIQRRRKYFLPKKIGRCWDAPAESEINPFIPSSACACVSLTFSYEILSQIRPIDETRKCVRQTNGIIDPRNFFLSLIQNQKKCHSHQYQSQIHNHETATGETFAPTVHTFNLFMKASRRGKGLCGEPPSESLNKMSCRKGEVLCDTPFTVLNWWKKAISIWNVYRLFGGFSHASAKIPIENTKPILFATVRRIRVHNSHTRRVAVLDRNAICCVFQFFSLSIQPYRRYVSRNQKTASDSALHVPSKTMFFSLCTVLWLNGARWVIGCGAICWGFHIFSLRFLLGGRLIQNKMRRTSFDCFPTMKFLIEKLFINSISRARTPTRMAHTSALVSFCLCASLISCACWTWNASGLIVSESGSLAINVNIMLSWKFD